MSIERFVVDSRLLRELGERLVGRPHIALAELIKNSYDADARTVEVYFSDDRIKIVDDGHGMSHADFSKRWLTIGTTVKEQNRESPELGRPFTGSKGVGRLSVQLLARRLELRTVALTDPTLRGRRRRMNASGAELQPEVVASIDWDRAILAGYIEDVEVEVDERAPSGTFADGSPCGTEIILTNLSHNWDANAFRELARELWPLQPPFDTPKDDETSFKVTLHSPYEDIVRQFNSQMHAILEIWTARVTGELLPPYQDPPPLPQYDLLDNNVHITTATDSDQSNYGPPRLLRVRVEFRQGTTREIAFRVSKCHIDQLSYEIRIFSLQHRQPQGLKVDTARQYMLSYGGVHIYDAGFHLPYYGPDNDWLKIERDHARRLSASRLLPSELQVPRGMLDLVSNPRIYGAVQISTTHEAHAAEANEASFGDVLTVQITRDRLVENTAFDDLVRLVRAAMDLYAMETARAKFAKAKARRDKVTKAPSARLRETGESLGSIRESVSEGDRVEFDRLTRQFEEAVADAEAIENASQAQTSLLGALATAGITAMAYEHEISKQIATVENISRKVSRLARNASGTLKSSLTEISQDLWSLAQRTKRIRAIFAPLSDEENRNSQDAGTVYHLLDELSNSLEIVSRGTKIEYDQVPRDLRFPRGGYPAWWSIFQNILMNAFNATLDCDMKVVHIDAGGNARTGWVRVQDTGTGIDLDDADRMFEPFERGQPISRERAALALGGSGLGLTIVRLVADELRVTVRFEQPEPSYRTSIRITWR
jgi:signal transduction histidine kinase